MIRTRFAPSPTGYLHIGGVRTALFSWLYARKEGGRFILRIEDTDLERSTEESVTAILEGMAWLGLDYDEGPFYQTRRFNRYRAVIQQLLDEGHAYYCYCSKERLEKLRQTQMAKKQKPRYDGYCRNRKDKIQFNVKPVVRFKNPQIGEVVVEDLIKGIVHFDNNELDDLILARSDGTPTYNLTVVVDDWDMNISHVIRGDDHLNNTPRQINILQALGATLPQYAHLPMILGHDGQRLSKRHGAVNVINYKEEGYLPQALLNYLVRLGWSHGDQEIFSQREMIDFFDIKQVNSKAAAFNPEKLLWLNQHYIKTSDVNSVATQLNEQFENLEINIAQGPDLVEIVKSQAERSKTLKEMAEKSRFFFAESLEYDEKAVNKNLTPEIFQPLQSLHDELAVMKTWEKESIHQVIENTAKKYQLSMGNIAQPLRVAVTGSTISPPIDVTVHLIGQARILQRIRQALTLIQGQKA
jgi:glutamyl-tRNA synthetase